MGSCVNKSQQIIELKVNEQIGDDPTRSKSEKIILEKKYSRNFNSKKITKKVSIPTLFSNDISKILLIPEFCDKNNINSSSEIIELFD